MSVPFMSHWEVHWTRLWRLLVILCLATGLYSCSAKNVDPQASQEPAVMAAESAQQAEAPPAEMKPAVPSAPIGEAALEGSFQLQELRVLEGMGQTTLRIRFSKAVTQYRHFTLSVPSRVVLDVFGDVKQMAKEENFRVGTSWVNDLKLSTAKGHFRLVAQINAGTVPHFTVQPDDNGLAVVIGPINRKISTKKDLLLIQGGRRVMMAKGPSTSQATATATAKVPSTPSSQEKKEYTGQRISLDFKDADIKNVFRLLAEISSLNIVVTEDVVKKVTVRLVDVPWDQAMDILLQTNGLGKEHVGNVVRISTVQRLRSERDAIRAARDAEQKLEDLQTAYVNVNYAKVTDLEARVKDVLTERGNVSSDLRTNTLVIRDVKKGVDNANELIARLDTRTPQVLIESNLIETTPSFARQLGIELGFRAAFPDSETATLAPVTKTVTGRGVGFESLAQRAAIAADPIGLTFSVLQDKWGELRDVRAILTAAEEEGMARTISRPSLVTLNNETSKIESLRVVRVPITTSTSVTQTGEGAVSSQVGGAVEAIEIGITLEVKPQVSSDGFILMEIKVKSSTLAKVSSGQAVLPDELTREAQSKVLVRDGETIVIGGILKETRSESEAGIPWMKDIPVLGWLFKQVGVKVDFEELMVFITPRIISVGSADLPNAEQLWRKALKETEGDRPLIPTTPVSP